LPKGEGFSSQNKPSCAGPGRRKEAVERRGRDVFNPAFRQQISNNSAICCAYAPLPCILEPKFGSLSLPPRIDRIRLNIFSFCNGRCIPSHSSNKPDTPYGKRSGT